ncbi:MAG TPA: hypothetical protein VGO59_05830 [Verrucomicrobiae bacterium]|jgi:hypothetical protein
MFFRSFWQDFSQKNIREKLNETKQQQAKQGLTRLVAVDFGNFGENGGRAITPAHHYMMCDSNRPGRTNRIFRYPGETGAKERQGRRECA